MPIIRLSFVVGIVFLALKLTGGVEWSWGFVLLPFVAFLGALKRNLTDV